MVGRGWPTSLLARDIATGASEASAGWPVLVWDAESRTIEDVPIAPNIIKAINYYLTQAGRLVREREDVLAPVEKHVEGSPAKVA